MTGIRIAATAAALLALGSFSAVACNYARPSNTTATAPVEETDKAQTAATVTPAPITAAPADAQTAQVTVPAPARTE